MECTPIENPLQSLEASEKLRNWIIGAVKRSNGRQNFQTVARELADKKAHLWVVYDDDGREAGLLVTDYQQYPTGVVWLNVRIGTGSMEACECAIETLKEFSKDRGFAGVEGVARTGWARIGKKHGFKETHRFLEYANV